MYIEVICALLDLYVIGFEVKNLSGWKKTVSGMRIMGELYRLVLVKCCLIGRQVKRRLARLQCKLGDIIKSVLR